MPRGLEGRPLRRTIYVLRTDLAKSIVVRAFTLLVALRTVALRAAGLLTLVFVIRALFWALDSRRFAISVP